MNTNSIKKKIVFVFGAGASFDAGISTQDKIFYQYFSKCDLIDDGNTKKLKLLFKTIFQIDDFSTLNNYSIFPTFEEVLGILEFAIQNNASLGKEFPIEDIRQLKETLIALIAKTIKLDMETPKNKNHEILIKNLFDNNKFTYSFVNLNYDILLDKALFNLYPKFDVDYGIDLWRNYIAQDWTKPRDTKIYLLKPHGSLNWFYCPSCNSIYLHLINEPRNTEIEPDIPECSYCSSKQTLFIIPPTFFKTLTNLNTAQILQNVQKEIANSDYLVFLGYSFPDADLHLKYIIKKAFQLSPKSREIIVIEKELKLNHYDAPDLKLLDVYLRYERIFKTLHFLPIGFEKFAKSPFEYLEDPGTHNVKPDKLDFVRWQYLRGKEYNVNENEVYNLLSEMKIEFIFSIDFDIIIPDIENPKFLISIIEDFDVSIIKKVINQFKTKKTKYDDVELIFIISNLWANDPIFKDSKVFYFEKLSEFKDYIDK